MMAQSRNSRWSTFDTFMTIATTLGLWLTQAQITEAASTPFNWDSIKPSTEIVWHRCHGTFECARLQVPLDYLDDANTNTTAIAMIKYASQPEFPEYSEKWGGPVLTNPGGPGYSGVEYVLTQGHELQKVAGPQFSIIGFDPRGVGNTQPKVDCFDSVADRLIWGIRGARNPGKNKHLIAEMLIKARHMEKICSESPKHRELLKHIGTASVAKDMLVMNNAIWDLANSNKGVRRKGVQYWGVSYGTALGLTFATLFPKDVERMVLDGVLDIHDWHSQKRFKMYHDTEHVWNSFFTFCSNAGPEKCSFHTGTKASDIHARFHTLLRHLREQPVGYMIAPLHNPTVSSGQTGVLNDFMLLKLIFDASYAPLLAYPGIAKILLSVEKTLKGAHDGEAILNGTGLYEYPLTSNATEDAITNANLMPSEAFIAIYCSDAIPKRNYTIPEHLQQVHYFEKQTPTFGETLGSGLLICTGYKAQAKWKADFPTEDRSKHGNGPEGAAPIFLVSTSGDPVTPLLNAYSMVKLFPKHGAFVGVQEGEGHGILSSPSNCMAKQIGQYFAEGKIASTKSGRFCAREVAPFVGQIDKRDGQHIDHTGRDALAKIGEGINRIRALSLDRF